MTAQKIKLGSDTLDNIYKMAPLLDETGRKLACTYMFGLVSGYKAESDKSDKTGRKTG